MRNMVLSVMFVAICATNASAAIYKYRYASGQIEMFGIVLSEQDAKARGLVFVGPVEGTAPDTSEARPISTVAKVCAVEVNCVANKMNMVAMTIPDPDKQSCSFFSHKQANEDFAKILLDMYLDGRCGFKTLAPWNHGEEGSIARLVQCNSSRMAVVIQGEYVLFVPK